MKKSVTNIDNGIMILYSGKYWYAEIIQRNVNKLPKAGILHNRIFLTRLESITNGSNNIVNINWKNNDIDEPAAKIPAGPKNAINAVNKISESFNARKNDNT